MKILAWLFGIVLAILLSPLVVALAIITVAIFYFTVFFCVSLLTMFALQFIPV